MSLKLRETSSNPSTGISLGPGDLVWSNPGNIASSDDSTAQVTGFSENEETEYLVMTGFSFSLARKSLIVSVRVDIEIGQSIQPVSDPPTFKELLIVKGGSPVSGTNIASNDELTSRPQIIYTFGGFHSGWSALLTEADVSDSGFGIAVKFERPVGAPIGSTVEIDTAVVTIATAHSIKQAIHARLIAQDLIKSLVGGRIYWSIAPSNATSPYLVFSRISSNSTQHQQGASGLAESRFQIDSYSDDADEVDALATAVRMVMDGYRGTTNDTFINKIILDNEIDGIEVPSVGRQNSIARTTQDYMVWHDESIPTT